MKNLITFLILIGFAFTGCVEGDQQIDEAAAETKEFLETFTDKAGKIIEKAQETLESSDGEGVKDLKSIVDEIAQKAKEVNQKLVEDSTFTNKLKDFSKSFEADAQKILEDFEQIINESDKKGKESKGGTEL